MSLAQGSDGPPVACDVAVVGGGPAGLAVAIGAALRGLSVIVIERRPAPLDKACGEGVLPAGLALLAELGVPDQLDPEGLARLSGVRYTQEDGTTATAPFPGNGGVGIRRTVLTEAMRRRAFVLGVSLRQPCALLGHERAADGVRLATSEGPIKAGILVAADGLRSPLRRAFGLEAPPSKQTRRFGLRQHFRIAPWSTLVEVSFADGVEAYVTPAGPRRVGVAFLWDEGRAPEPPTIPALLARFPALEARLGGAAADSRPRGAGPLYQTATRRVSDRFALVGDAAGYIDALTGEGLSVALAGAQALSALLPSALAAGATARSLAPYEHAWRRVYRHYSLVARAMLALARRPVLRRLVIRLLARSPRLFRASLAWAVGAGSSPPHPALSAAPSLLDDPGPAG